MESWRSATRARAPDEAGLHVEGLQAALEALKEHVARLTEVVRNVRVAVTLGGRARGEAVDDADTIEVDRGSYGPVIERARDEATFEVILEDRGHREDQLRVADAVVADTGTDARRVGDAGAREVGG